MSRTRPPTSIVGAFSTLINLPCMTPPYLYAEATALTAAKMFASVFRPDLKELYHLGRGNSLAHDISHGLRDVLTENSIDPAPSTEFLFPLVGLADQLVWWAFVASIAGEGLINFTSQILELENCKHTGSARYWNGILPDGAIQTNGDFEGVDWSATNGQGRQVIWSGPIVSPGPGQNWTLGGMVTFHDIGGKAVSVSQQIVNLTTGAIIKHTDPGRPGYYPGKKTPLFAQGQGSTAGTDIYALQWSCTDSVFLDEVFPDESSFVYGYPWG